MFALLDAYAYLEKYDLRSLRYICFGGGVVSLTTLKSLMAKMPATGFVQTYGQTECSPRVTALLPEDAIKKLGSVGKPIPGVQVEVVAKDGVLASINEPGEIRVKGKNTSPGYYKRFEETAKIRKGDWLYTGDLGRYDTEGYIWLVGRNKNVIISGGLKVYPEEVEAILGTHPLVHETIVRGESDPVLGEIPVADVVCKPGCRSEQFSQKLFVFMKARLAAYKIPRRIHLRETLDKTATGKLRRA
jgi:long-chain acyl-CoA synthetase